MVVVARRAPVVAESPVDDRAAVVAYLRDRAAHFARHEDDYGGIRFRSPHGRAADAIEGAEVQPFQAWLVPVALRRERGIAFGSWVAFDEAGRLVPAPP
ncbi:hypothetical protein [Cellulomonas sp. URHB0016]